MQIHSQSEPPFVQELGFGVAPGFQTFVATQEQRVSPKFPFHLRIQRGFLGEVPSLSLMPLGCIPIINRFLMP